MFPTITKKKYRNALKNKNKAVDLVSKKSEIILYQEAFENLKKLTGGNDVNEII